MVWLSGSREGPEFKPQYCKKKKESFVAVITHVLCTPMPLFTPTFGACGDPEPSLVAFLPLVLSIPWHMEEKLDWQKEPRDRGVEPALPLPCCLPRCRLSPGPLSVEQANGGAED
jgi:hypothetical protein